MNRFPVVLAIALLSLGCLAAEPPPALPLGSSAPDFSLLGVDGRHWALKDFSAAKLLVVVFTCNHCPTAQYYEERIKQLVVDYRDKGVAVVAISPNDPKAVRLNELGYTDLGDSYEDMKIRAQHREYNFPYLYDGDTETVSRAYGPAATPHVFIFDSARKLRFVGRIDDSEREQFVKTRDTRIALDLLLSGQEPVVAQTKVIGCSVKWAAKADAGKAELAKFASELVGLSKIDAKGLKALRKNDSGKLRLVGFWATWCAPCVAEFDEFVTMNRMYRQREFELVMVALNRPDEEKGVLEFLQRHQASNKNLIFASPDRDALIDAFDPKWQGAVPLTVLIRPDGTIAFQETGTIDSLALKRTIVKELNAIKPW